MFDLHIHSIYSDGDFSPAQIIKAAISRGIRYLSLTDHDTLDGLAPIKVAGEKYPVTIIPGIEISCQWEESEVHILGYYIDPENTLLKNTLSHLKETRKNRVIKIFQRLQELGIEIDLDFLEDFAREGCVGRPHVAKALVKSGAAKTIDEAFRKYLVEGGLAFIPKEKMTPYQAAEMIHAAGGIAVIAHPALLPNFPEIFPPLLDMSLDGIEAYYPAHSALQTDYFVTVARERGMTVTAGSDFHSKNRGLAKNPGCLGAPQKIIEDFLAFCGKQP